MNKKSNLDNSNQHTYVTSARLDIRTLAALVNYYEENHGFAFDSRNELLNTAFEHVRKALDLEKPSTEESLQFLRSRGLCSQKNKTKKTTKALQTEKEKFESALSADDNDDVVSEKDIKEAKRRLSNG